MKNMKQNKSGGFTLFVALIVTSLLLSVGFSLSNIILKQLVFAQSSRESQISFYAADSGVECALFWDRKNQFGTTTLYGAFATSTEVDGFALYDIYCGHGISVDPPQNYGKIGSFNKLYNQTAATTTFYINLEDAVTGPELRSQKGACAKVVVSKWLDTSDPTNPRERTIIDSRGYNVRFDGLVGLDDAVPPAQTWRPGGCDIASNRVVERAIRLDY